MVIAMDWDETFTRDVAFWGKVVSMARNYGHTVVLCTMRRAASERIPLQYEEMFDSVIYTSRKAKKPFLERYGIKPDVWIDDNPAWILGDSG